MGADSIRIGALTLVPGRELVGASGGGVAIGGRALDILSVLAGAQGALVTKNELLSAVWAGAIVEDNALQAQISAARKALGGEATRLVTVHGRGYRLELDGAPSLAVAPADAASIAVREACGTVDTSDPRGLRHRNQCRQQRLSDAQPAVTRAIARYQATSGERLAGR